MAFEGEELGALEGEELWGLWPHPRPTLFFFSPFLRAFGGPETAGRTWSRPQL